MPTPDLTQDSAASEPSDAALIDRVRRGDPSGFVPLMQRYNQRLFRVARAIVRDDVEAEDILQHAYLSAFTHLHQFAGMAAFSTWLTRIVVNHALLRQRQQQRLRGMAEESGTPDWRSGTSGLLNPEDHASRNELARALEAAIDALPETYRAIVVLREIDGMSVQEAAECLAISEEAARVRLHRARTMLRVELGQRAGAAVTDVFAIGGERCAAIVTRVQSALLAKRAV
jgi:RNA polymerase sigma-70 factor, ECF subfamily